MEQCVITVSLLQDPPFSSCSAELYEYECYSLESQLIATNHPWESFSECNLHATLKAIHYQYYHLASFKNGNPNFPGCLAGKEDHVWACGLNSLASYYVHPHLC